MLAVDAIVGPSFMGGYHTESVNSGMTAHVAQNTETSPATFYWANKGWKNIYIIITGLGGNLFGKGVGSFQAVGDPSSPGMGSRR